MANDKNKNQDNVDKLRPHQYDGIQEYDNALPRWWLWLLYATLFYAPIYLFHYHLGTGESLQAELQHDLQASQETMASSSGKEVPADYSVLSRDPKVLAAGKAAYEVNCVPCHGAQGQGGIGANLTDKYWLHGGSADSIHKIIASGVLDKGMPGWMAVVGADKVQALTAYVLTLKNTNAAGGKAAQGSPEEIESQK